MNEVTPACPTCQVSFFALDCRSPIRQDLTSSRPVHGPADGRTAVRPLAPVGPLEVRSTPSCITTNSLIDELRELAVFITHYVGFPLGSRPNSAIERVAAAASRWPRNGSLPDTKANVAEVLAMNLVNRSSSHVSCANPGNRFKPANMRYCWRSAKTRRFPCHRCSRQCRQSLGRRAARRRHHLRRRGGGRPGLAKSALTCGDWPRGTVSAGGRRRARRIGIVCFPGPGKDAACIEGSSAATSWRQVGVRTANSEM